MPGKDAAGQHRMQRVGAEQRALHRDTGLVQVGAEVAEDFAFRMPVERGIGDGAGDIGENLGVHARKIGPGSGKSDGAVDNLRQKTSAG